MATEQHRVKSRCQPSLLDIDAMCGDLMKDCMQEAKEAVRPAPAEPSAAHQSKIRQQQIVQEVLKAEESGRDLIADEDFLDRVRVEFPEVDEGFVAPLAWV